MSRERHEHIVSTFKNVCAKNGGNVGRDLDPHPTPKNVMSLGQLLSIVYSLGYKTTYIVYAHYINTTFQYIMYFSAHNKL